MFRFVMLAFLAVAPSAVAQHTKVQTPKSVHLYVFDCGSLNIPDTSPYQLKKEDLATSYMSVPCFLIAHPKGALMWDVGAVPDSAFKPGAANATLRYATSVKPLTAQLAEIAVTMRYLPQPVGEEELRALVSEAVAATGATTAKDMGKVIGAVMAKVKGRADGGAVSRLVKEALAG